MLIVVAICRPGNSGAGRPGLDGASDVASPFWVIHGAQRTGQKPGTTQKNTSRLVRVKSFQQHVNEYQLKLLHMRSRDGWRECKGQIAERFGGGAGGAEQADCCDSAGAGLLQRSQN